MRDQLFRTRITDLLGIRHPILCGGLGPGVSTGRYVAAVINAGGMGFVVSTAYEAPDQFELELKVCRDLIGNKPVGVNLYISRFAGGVERVLHLLPLLEKYGVTCVETAGASPEPVIPALKEMGITVLHKIPSVRYLHTAERVGADAVIVVGAECGGHPGVDQVGTIVQAAHAPQVSSLPVVAAGGFGTGRQLVAALAMGNDAILMGSRMLVSEELWIHEDYKRKVVEGRGYESVVVKKLLRDHHRVLHNESAQTVLELEAQGIVDFEAYRPYVGGDVTRAAYRSGDVTKGMIDYGHAVVFADEIQPVEKIFDRILDDAENALHRLHTVQLARAGEIA